MTTSAATSRPSRPTLAGTSRNPWAVAGLAVIAALPSLVAGIGGGGFLTDDWAVWLVFDRLGVVDAITELAFVQPGRPLAAPYYAFTYLVIGDSPVIQSLLIGAINAGVVVAAWAFGRLVLPARVLWPALTVLALAPNHAMTRLWYVAGTYPLSLAVVFLALADLVRGRPVRAAVLLVAATLLYEGPVVFGLAVAGIWVLGDLRTRRRDGLVVAVPTFVAAAGALLLSPKRTGPGPDPFDNADTFLSAQVGVGLWGSPLLARVGGAAVLLALTLALARQLPSFRSRRVEYRLMLIGAALAVLSAVPFFVSGSIFGTTGVFDRNNLVPSVGVALVLGSIWSLLRTRSELVAALAAALVVGWFAVLQSEDVWNYADAVIHGDRLVETLAATGADDEGLILVVPRQEDEGTGLADFIYDGDLVGAMRYRHGGDWSRMRLIENVRCGGLEADNGTVQIFDWRRGVLTPMSAREVEARCDAWQST